MGKCMSKKVKDDFMNTHSTMPPLVKNSPNSLDLTNEKNIGTNN